MTCKYETWKTAVPLVELQRNIAFCLCAACSIARRDARLGTNDPRPSVRERVEVLKRKESVSADDTIPDGDVN